MYQELNTPIDDFCIKCRGKRTCSLISAVESIVRSRRMGVSEKAELIEEERIRFRKKECPNVNHPLTNPAYLGIT